MFSRVCDSLSTKAAPEAPSITLWSYESENGIINRGTNSFLFLSNTGFHSLFETPRIATSGGLTIGAKAVPPIPPRLEIVNVLPLSSSGLSFFSLAL